MNFNIMYRKNIFNILYVDNVNFIKRKCALLCCR